MMAKALRLIESREGSQVMCYIDDVIIATETVEDHLIRLREVFECLRNSWTQVQVGKMFIHEDPDESIWGESSPRMECDLILEQWKKSGHGNLRGMVLN